MAQNGTVAYVPALPPCDICNLTGPLPQRAEVVTPREEAKQ